MGLQDAVARPGKFGPAPPVAPLPIASATFAKDVCALIANRARWRGMDEHFIARLISAESRFSPVAVSPAGAQGIAQFMPGTARLRRLPDPFDPASALTAAIDYLAELRVKFGNLGLAAAAYNAGEAAAAAFARGGGLPLETRNYVLRITGREVEAWRDPAHSHPIEPISRTMPFEAACVAYVNAPADARLAAPSAPRQPWGVLIAESFSQAAAIRMFNAARRRFPEDLQATQPMLVRHRNLSMGRKLRHSARIGAASQQAARDICRRLRSQSVVCIVARTR